MERGWHEGGLTNRYRKDADFYDSQDIIRRGDHYYVEGILVNTWYHNLYDNILVFYKDDRTGVGIIPNNKWVTGVPDNFLQSVKNGHWHPASMDIIKAKLDRQAYERGIKTPADVQELPLGEKSESASHYDPSTDSFYMFGHTIYRKGVWLKPSPNSAYYFKVIDKMSTFYGEIGNNTGNKNSHVELTLSNNQRIYLYPSQIMGVEGPRGTGFSNHTRSDNFMGHGYVGLGNHRERPLNLSEVFEKPNKLEDIKPFNKNDEEEFKSRAIITRKPGELVIDSKLMFPIEDLVSRKVKIIKP